MPINRIILHSLAPAVIVVHVKADALFLDRWSKGQDRFPHRPLHDFPTHRLLEHWALDWACSQLDPPLSQAQISHTEIGKPVVATSKGQSPIHISVSHHTQGEDCWLALCWSKSHAVGCDIERPRAALRTIAPRILNAQEMAAAGDSLETLCHLWTIKECMFKAFGPGIDFREDLSVSREGHSELSSVELNTWIEVIGAVRGENHSWHVMTIDAPELDMNEKLCLACGPA